MYACKLSRNHYNFLAATQLPRGLQAPWDPQTLSWGQEHLHWHSAFSWFVPFSTLPHLRDCFGKARIRDVLIRLALLTERINSPWHFDVLNSHHKFINVSWGAEFVWEGCTVQGGWGGVLQGTEGFSSLGGVICHPGANTFRFLQRLMFSTCRNTLREKYFVCV